MPDLTPSQKRCYEEALPTADEVRGVLADYGPAQPDLTPEQEARIERLRDEVERLADIADEREREAAQLREERDRLRGALGRILREFDPSDDVDPVVRIARAALDPAQSQQEEDR
jgi:hypothetical protein